jgi:hypothetical protein
MSQQFDDFSKHLATTKRSRRGVLKLLTAGFFGLAGSAVIRGGADAKTPGPRGNTTPMTPHINQTSGYEGFPYINQGQYPFRFPYINQSYPYINQDHSLATLRERWLEFFFGKHP